MNDRVTLYVRSKKRKELLRRVREYTRAKSTSEAVFAALAELLAYKEKEERARTLAALESTQGAWAGDRKVEQALEWLSEGWKGWKTAEF